jgi:hypothetical protein
MPFFNTSHVAEVAAALPYGSTYELPPVDIGLDVAKFPPGITIDARQARFLPVSADVDKRTVTLSGGSRWIGGRFDAGKLALRDQLKAKIAALPEGTEIDDTVHCPPALYTEAANVTIEKASFSGFERPIMAVNANRFELLDTIINGIWDGAYNPETKIDPATKDFIRTTYGVHIGGGRNSRIERLTVNRAGGAVVVGSAGKAGLPSAWKITDVIGNLLGDNGVYLSSAQDCEVASCQFANVSGVAVKLRGTGHTADRITANACFQGVGIEGVGKIADDFGSNGSGHQVTRCTFRDLGHCGVWAGDHLGLFARDYTIANNLFIRAPFSLFGATSMTACPISLRGGQGARILGNTFENCAGDCWLHIGQWLAADAKMTGWTVDALNTVRGGSLDVRVRDAIFTAGPAGLRGPLV